VLRLYSTFAHGAPGAGLLLMRVAAGGALLYQGVVAFDAGMEPAWAAIHLLCTATGLLLIVGMWTPVVGVLTAIDAALRGLLGHADMGFYILLTTLGVALALLGPGAWSVDAHLFGWRRVEIRNGDAHGKRHGPRPE
jgi:putative oxidoreductase